MYPFKRMSKKIIGTLLINSHPKALSAKISNHANTILHIAVLAADKDPLHLEISPFVHFMVQILFHKSNDIQTALSFKILNDSVIFNLDHEMETLHFISNGEILIPRSLQFLTPLFGHYIYIFMLFFFSTISSQHYILASYFLSSQLPIFSSKH